MKIGIISENYFYDSKALKALLDKFSFVKELIFIPIGKKITGDKLLTPKVTRIINKECKANQIELVILVKDLDSLPSDQNKIDQINSKIKTITKNTNLTIIPFIVIFEQEALILADIQTFNHIYKTKYPFKGNPKFQSEPKELLKQITRKAKRKYKESDIPEIFQQLNFQKVYQNHKGEYSFQSFIDELTTILN